MCSSGTISHNKCSCVKKKSTGETENRPGVTVFYNTLSQKAPHLCLSRSTNRRAGCKRSVANSEKITFKQELEKKKKGNVGKKKNRSSMWRSYLSSDATSLGERFTFTNAASSLSNTQGRKFTYCGCLLEHPQETFTEVKHSVRSTVLVA